MRKRAAGLTLVELMITLAILAIIASVGYPMYTAQVLKARRADARAGVMELAMAEEREFAAWGGYSESNSITGVTFADGAPAPDANSTFDDDVARIAREYGQFYTFTITADNSTYTISAAPTAVQASDTACASFSVDQTGAKNATDVDLCW
jgi:type IV pilus assembly protein PilE